MAIDPNNLRLAIELRDVATVLADLIGNCSSRRSSHKVEYSQATAEQFSAKAKYLANLIDLNLNGARLLGRAAGQATIQASTEHRPMASPSEGAV